jgi:glycogen synthase kinase 3 beta
MKLSRFSVGLNTTNTKLRFFSLSQQKSKMAPKGRLVNPQTSVDNTKDAGPTVINGIRLSSNVSLIQDEPDAGKSIVVQANDGKTGETVELTYCNTKVIGNGSFGVVFQAKLQPSGQLAAVKKVLQDKRFKVSLI